MRTTNPAPRRRKLVRLRAELRPHGCRPRTQPSRSVVGRLVNGPESRSQRLGALETIRDFFQQLHQYIAVAGQRLAVAAEPLADQFRESGQEIRAAADMDLVQLNHSFAGSVPANLEWVASLRRPGD